MSITYFIDSALRDRQTSPDPLNWTLDVKQVETWANAPKAIKAIHPSAQKNPLDFASTVQILKVDIPYPRPELFGTIVTATSIDALSNLIFPSNLPPAIVVGTILWTSSTNGGPYGVPADLPLYVVALTATTLQLSTYAGGPPLALSPATLLTLNFVIFTPATQASYEDSRIVLTTPLLFLTLRCKEYPDLRNIRCLNGSHADTTHLLFRGGVTQGLDGAPAFIEWYAKAEQTQRWNLRDFLVIGFETRDGSPLTVFKETAQTQLLDMDPQRQLVMSFLVTPFIRDATYSNHFLEPEEG